MANAMQGMMAATWTRHPNVRRNPAQMQSRAVTEVRDNPMLNAEAWSQFVKMQGPAIQG